MWKSLLLTLALLLVPVGARATTEPTPRDVAEAMRNCLDIEGIVSDDDSARIRNGRILGGGSRLQSLTWSGYIVKTGVDFALSESVLYQHPRHPEISLAEPRFSALTDSTEARSESYAQGLALGCFMGTLPN
jgi:hypothetical protein